MGYVGMMGLEWGEMGMMIRIPRYPEVKCCLPEAGANVRYGSRWLWRTQCAARSTAAKILREEYSLPPMIVLNPPHMLKTRGIGLVLGGTDYTDAEPFWLCLLSHGPRRPIGRKSKQLLPKSTEQRLH